MSDRENGLLHDRRNSRKEVKNMYFERDVGGRTSLIFIDHIHSHGNLYHVASDYNGQLILEEGYSHGRDADAAEGFAYADGLERRKSA